MKKVTFAVLFFISFCLTDLFAQVYKGIEEVATYHDEMDRIDSYLKLNPNSSYELIKELRQTSQKDNNILLSILCDIYEGTYYYYVSQNDSSLFYFGRAIKVADSIGNYQLRSSASIRKLFVIDEGVESSLMLDLMKEEYLIALSNKDTLNMIYSLNGLGSYTADIDSTSSSSEYYIKAIEIAEQSNNEFELGFLYNNFALLKLRLGAPEEAIKDLDRGLEIAKKLNSIRLELILIDNYGYYYSSIDSIDLAKKQYEYALDVAKERNFPQIELLAMINLSSIERLQGNVKRGDSLANVSLEIAKQKNVKHFISYIYLELAHSQVNNHEYGKALKFLDSAAYYAKFGPRGDIMLSYYLQKSNLFKQKGDYKSALEFYIKMDELSDSLNRETHLQIMTQIQLKYDVEKKEMQRIKEKLSYENKIRIKEENEAKIRQWFIVLFFSFLLIISFISILYFRNKNYQETKFSNAMIDLLEKERERIARDLHDGIGQNLIIIKNKFNNLNIEKTIMYEEINENLSSTLEDVRSISRSLIPPELKRLGLHKSIDKMLNEIAKSTGLVVSSDLDLLDKIKLSKSNEVRIYRIVQELLTNTIKHSKATSLKVEFRKINNGYLIIYQDNGVGIQEEYLQEKSSMGLRSIRSRLKMMNGTIRFEKPDTGFKVVLRIKDNKL